MGEGEGDWNLLCLSHAIIILYPRPRQRFALKEYLIRFWLPKGGGDSGYVGKIEKRGWAVGKIEKKGWAVGTGQDRKERVGSGQYRKERVG